MKVKELIKQLKKMPENAEVFFSYWTTEDYESTGWEKIEEIDRVVLYGEYTHGRKVLPEAVVLK